MGHEELSEPSIEELLRRARDGEADALEELFRQCQPTLEKWADRSFSRPPPGGTSPSDIVQDTAEHAFRQFSKFKGATQGEWFAWLHTIFHNQATDLVRSAQRQKRAVPGTVSMDSSEALEAPSPHKSPSQATAHQEEWRQLLAHLFQLPDDQRDAIWLCHLKELPVAEVAQLMGKTEGSVAGLLQRGLRALRTHMGEPASTSAAMNEAAAALLTYLQRRDAGEKMDAATFLAGHPACAEELSAMLHWMERLQALRPLSPNL